ncbi:MAG TPA: glycoside hydrolase family 43 protein [Phycisphaerae bacterium]|nr:glycoside hydrolase family 43 protein [Phycisphaerae bacterium]
MKRQRFCGLAAIALATAHGWACRADNPVVQTKFTADPAPLVVGDTLYLITSHDEDDARGFHMLDWQCYSTKDMVNWTDHGAIASLATFKWAVQNNDAWAPQVVPRDGKFFLYVPISARGNPKNVIAVAVADNPLGPYTDPLGKPLIERGNGYIDPSAFVDDDGQAYLYFGNPNAWFVKLNKDMTSYSGEIIKAEGKPKNYQEGPWIYKRNGHYYLAYASTCCPEGIGYAMSDKPTGPWEFKGNIMDGTRLSDGNHPGIADFKGKSYVFGFNYKLNWEIAPAKRERRSVCVAELTYHADGTIEKLPWWTDQGVAQVGKFDPYVQVDAATICYEKGVKTLMRGQGKQGVYVSAVENGAWIKIKGVDFGDKGAARFTATLAAAAEDANLTLRLDSEVGTAIGALKIKSTGGLDKWESQSCNVTGAKGVHDVYFKFFGSASPVMSVDSWKFEQ